LSKDDQSADGDWARYVVADRTIVMGDSVLLRQGKNVIRGTKLFIDLNSGRSRVTGGAVADGEKPGSNGRVKALFMPTNAENQPAKPPKK
jgi:lipopolysaccharide export system protein LptA